MSDHGYALFDTAIGRCGVAWGPKGIRGFALPEANERALRTRLGSRFPGAQEAEPPAAVRGALDAVVAFLGGEPVDLVTIPLDMNDLPPFFRRVYDEARTIEKGTSLSYGKLAARLGSPGSARAVGQAMGRNPFPIVVPCHRVMASNGKLGGFTAHGGVHTKLRLLALEAGPAGELAYDPEAAVAALRASDEELAKLIDEIGPLRLRPKPSASTFVALAEAIVYQQLTGRAAATIFARVRALFPRGHEGPTPDQILRAPDERLLGAGLSRGKLLALRDLARRTKDGEIPTLDELTHLDDEQIVELLTVVRGIGRWTVEMLLIFRLGRPDVLPVDDYGVRKGFAATFSKRGTLPSPEALVRRGQRWRPYRSVASWYLWRAAERSPRRTRAA